MEHLVYCDDKEKVLEKIMDGTKTMVVRGAAGRKIPHSRVFEGEKLYFMKKGSKAISARAVVKSVQNYVKLSEEAINEALESNQDRLNLSEKQKKRWQRNVASASLPGYVCRTVPALQYQRLRFPCPKTSAQAASAAELLQDPGNPGLCR